MPTSQGCGEETTALATIFGTSKGFHPQKL